jgi:hypothetical protein
VVGGPHPDPGDRTLPMAPPWGVGGVPNRIEKGAGEERMVCTLNLIDVLAGATLSSIKSFLANWFSIAP